MILLDANVLLYAYDASSPFHPKAKPWLEAALSGTEPVGFPWPTVLAFLRIATNQRVLGRPLSIEEATAIVSSWLALPHVVLADDRAHAAAVALARDRTGSARLPVDVLRHAGTLTPAPGRNAAHRTSARRTAR